MVDALVVGTHPDDIEIGFGGSVARLVDLGYDVAMLDLTNGEPTPFGDPATRAKEAGTAADILKVKTRITLDLENRKLMDTVEARRKVAEIYRRLQPKMVFIQGEQDSHPDHIEGSRIAWKARFDAKLTKTDMAHAPWYPKKIFFYHSSHLRQIVNPAFIMDITKTFDRKVEALCAYKSQFYATGREDEIIEKLNARAAYFGDLIGVKRGEPVMTKSPLGLSDLRDIVL